MTASGSVSDYADISSLQTRIAQLAGVDASFVALRVEAASVLIIATIAVPASTTASAVQSALSSSLSTAEAASSALGITVESLPVITTANTASADLEAEEDSGTLIIAVTAGGCSAVFLLAVGVLGFVLVKRSQRAQIDRARRAVMPGAVVRAAGERAAEEELKGEQKRSRKVEKAEAARQRKAADAVRRVQALQQRVAMLSPATTSSAAHPHITASELQKQLEELEAQKAAAAQGEDFEAAAQLKRQIEALRPAAGPGSCANRPAARANFRFLH